MKGITVIIPAFNEEKNLVNLLPQLHSILSGCCQRYELLVVDAEKSRDATEVICKENGAKYIRQQKSGYADAFRLGVSNATYEAIVVVDADCSQDVSKIPLMYEAVKNGSDVVIGSRYANGGVSNDPFVSVVMSRTLNFVYRFLFGLKQCDISTDFRFYNKDQLLTIETQCTNFDVIEETLILLKRRYPDLKITEIPIEYNPRKQGYSKRKLLMFISDYIKLIFRLLCYKK